MSCFTDYFGSDYDSVILATAILRGDVATVDLFVRLGATISEQHQWTLYQACLEGLDMIKALLASPDITSIFCQPNEGGDSILHFILRAPSTRFHNNKSQVVELLSEHGADLFQPDQLGETV